MNTLIRQRALPLFLDNNRQWKADARQAQAFPRIAEAIDFCAQHGISDVQIIENSLPARPIVLVEIKKNQRIFNPLQLRNQRRRSRLPHTSYRTPRLRSRDSDTSGHSA